MDNFEIPVFDVELKDESGIEIMEIEQDELAALLVEQNEILTNIRDDVHLVMFLVLLTFCWSGIRAWRKSMGRGSK